MGYPNLCMLYHGKSDQNGWFGAHIWGNHRKASFIAWDALLPTPGAVRPPTNAEKRCNSFAMDGHWTKWFIYLYIYIYFFMHTPHIHAYTIAICSGRRAAFCFMSVSTNHRKAMMYSISLSWCTLSKYVKENTWTAGSIPVRDDHNVSSCLRNPSRSMLVCYIYDCLFIEMVPCN